MSQTKIKTKFVSAQAKETMTRLKMNHQIHELEFKRQSNKVTESLLSAKCMYMMSAVFALALPNYDPTQYSDRKNWLNQQLLDTPELTHFLDLLIRNHTSSICIFIPFRSLNEYLEMFPLTIFLFAKHHMEEYFNDKDNESHPICYHLVYRTNGANKVDTFKTIQDTYTRLDQLSGHTIDQFVCQFEEKEIGQYNVSVCEVLK